jgi:hypothetical protein
MHVHACNYTQYTCAQVHSQGQSQGPVYVPIPALTCDDAEDYSAWPMYLHTLYLHPCRMPAMVTLRIPCPFRQPVRYPQQCTWECIHIPMCRPCTRAERALYSVTQGDNTGYTGDTVSRMQQQCIVAAGMPTDHPLADPTELTLCPSVCMPVRYE